MRIPSLRQRDGTTCGPSVALMAAAILEPDCRWTVADQRSFALCQLRVHRAVNRLWPRRLGTTPAGVARAVTEYCGRPYRWRLSRGLSPRSRGWCGRDTLGEVLRAVDAGLPVAMLVGRVLPRHWVLLVAPAGPGRLQCYEPSSGQVRTVDVAAIRHANLEGVGYPRPFAFVLPRTATRSATA